MHTNSKYYITYFNGAECLVGSDIESTLSAARKTARKFLKDNYSVVEYVIYRKVEEGRGNAAL